MNRKRKAYLAASAAALSFTLMAGCSAIQKQQVRDLEGVPVEDPDKVALITNVDQYPNVVALCIKGVGFVSTTRDYTSLQESPGLTEKWCSQ